ncbi:transposase [Desulforapulum autotrophicum HRM2]|uniref:Transposase n=1 Tax=Desulforapulum autotrophicum (strain ATCC 43914 / DSM 3382 / VKM B-1955 / HRM2) TaxID=177437 RepID=C0QEW0_DESAH|nr:transposase [Desulforapulum autotrophicum HRM2]
MALVYQIISPEKFREIPWKNGQGTCPSQLIVLSEIIDKFAFFCQPETMIKMLGNLVSFIWSKFKVTSNLAAENLVLRQQLAVMKWTNKRPKIRRADRLFWVLLSQIWTPWRKSLIIVKSDTVICWHRKGFKLFWKFKSTGPGRPQVSREIRDLVRRMATANSNWGAPRIHGELLRLGFEVSERTVSNRMPRRRPNSKPSQTWRTFLKNHSNKCSIDFFSVPTISFKVLFVLVILSHSRRKVVHFSITSNPTAEWTTQQIVEAFPWDTAPKYLMRDRDSSGCWQDKGTPPSSWPPSPWPSPPPFTASCWKTFFSPLCCKHTGKNPSGIFSSKDHFRRGGCHVRGSSPTTAGTKTGIIFNTVCQTGPVCIL